MFQLKIKKSNQNPQNQVNKVTLKSELYNSKSNIYYNLVVFSSGIRYVLTSDQKSKENFTLHNF